MKDQSKKGKRAGKSNQPAKTGSMSDKKSNMKGSSASGTRSASSHTASGGSNS